MYKCACFIKILFMLIILPNPVLIWLWSDVVNETTSVLCIYLFLLNFLLHAYSWNRRITVKTSYPFFFIIQSVESLAIPYPHQPPTMVDNTISVAQGGTATPGATKQFLLPDRVTLRQQKLLGNYVFSRNKENPQQLIRWLFVLYVSILIF